MKMDDIDLIYRVMPEHEAIHARLENWANWSKDRFRYQHCASAEWRYKSPPNDDDRMPRVLWDSLDAIAMHRVICDLPYKHRMMLNMWYIHHDDKDRHMKRPSKQAMIRRKLGLTRDGAADTLKQARQMCINRNIKLDNRKLVL